jgi:hypothetical protein
VSVSTIRIRTGQSALRSLLLVTAALAPGAALAAGGPPPGAAPAVGAAPAGATPAPAGSRPAVRVVTDAAGSRLQVDGRDFMVRGMNWDYIPIGENYLYDLWKQPDDVIVAALDREMPLLKAMGVNAIRQYVGIPPRWVQYIYERYGILTVLNHPCARYGYTLDGVWTPSVDFSDPRLRAALTAEIGALVAEFDGVPGVLMWLLGNENNYGLTWTSFEIEALPAGERDAARARHLYSMFEQITRAIKERDPRRPVAIANGDLQYIGLIAEECKSLDILGTNVYRGISARDLFQEVKDKLGIPVMYSEFGADAWNAKEMREDQITQARYLLGQWQEIFEHSAGHGLVGNAIGGFIFQWSDGWWKYGQDSRLDVHDTHASWPNGGYAEDFVEGENNMNEEWWGITAKGKPDFRGLYELYPRAAYYALKLAFTLDPYAPGVDRAAIRAHFAAIDPVVVALDARAASASRIADGLDPVRLANVRMEFETYSTGGARISTPPAETPQTQLPAFVGFDHLESFYTDFEVRPAQNVLGTLSVNILGHVPVNPIDEIFYENRGRQRTLVDESGDLVRLEGIERVKVYRATISWDDRWFGLDAFYRAGHTHWGYEGDLFGLYRDAYYGENVDTYNAEAPVGFELAGRKTLDGLKFALGSELFWGANPSFLIKYRRALGSITYTGVYQNEFAKQTTVTSSTAIPTPPTRRATLSLETRRGLFDIELGGIWAGSTKKGELFQIAEESGDTYRVLQDSVRTTDTFGVRAKIAMERGIYHWYAQGAYAGIVADYGPTAVQNFTGWTLEDTGLGNGVNLMSGVAVQVDDYQIGPNFLWQKPLVGPVPAAAPPPGRPRNILDDPFAVRANREMTAGEVIVTYDPTPATWLWAWDNDVREDARLAGSLGFVVRHFPTTQDAAIGVLANGDTFAFPGATPPRTLWEVKARLVSRLRGDRRASLYGFFGAGEPNGNDQRLVYRYGLGGRAALGATAVESSAKFGDWGPYDYHRDFNLTFPVQLMGDISRTLGAPRWFGAPETRIGLRGTWRSLDEHSSRYCPELVPGPTGTPACDPTAPGANGREWEVRTYLNVSI